MSSGPRFARSIKSITIGEPNFAHEGFNGYIETTITVEVNDLVEFSALYNEWYTLPIAERNAMYYRANGEQSNCTKARQ